MWADSSFVGVAEEDSLAQRDGHPTEEGATPRWGFPTCQREKKHHASSGRVYYLFLVLRRETSHPPIPHYGGAAGGRPDKMRRHFLLHATSFSHEVRGRNSPVLCFSRLELEGFPSHNNVWFLGRLI